MTSGRERLIIVLEDLVHEARSEDGGTWENTSLPAFLEAMAAWLRVYEHGYINTGLPVPDDPWEVIIAAVQAATVYE